MTDGGDGHRDDDAERIRREPIEDVTSDSSSDERVDGTLSQSSKRASESTDGRTDGQHPGDTWDSSGEGPGEASQPATGESSDPDFPSQATAQRATGERVTEGESSDKLELGEPTPTKIARIRARESSLEQEEITAYTTDQRSLDPSVQLQWGVWTAIVSVILGSIAGAILGNFGMPPELGTAVVGLFLVLGVVWVVLRYRAWLYQVREDSLYLERGVVTHVRTIVPYVRIQHVDTSQSPLERALGLSTLVVYTAGSRGADVSVPGLKPEEARDLQQRLKELAIQAEGDDAL